MLLTEDQIWELWMKISTFTCPTHPEGGCNPKMCLECQEPTCGETKHCSCVDRDF